MGLSKKIMIYYHANAEDIGLCYEMLDHIRSTLRINVIAPEYPGYGIYTKVKKGVHEHPRASPKLIDDEDADPIIPSAEQIQQDADCIYDFLIHNFNLQEQDIIVFGRSMGSGPTVYLGSTRSPAAIITMSAYTSIKNVVKDSFSFLCALVAEQFNNLERMN